MTALVMRNNLQADGPLVAPTRPDGSAYAFCAYINADVDVVFADSYQEILEVLIPGYAQLSGADAARARIALAQAVAAQVQGAILAQASEDGIEPTDEEWAVLAAPRDQPQPRADWWTCPIPLVAVETSYEPFTQVPRPASGLAAGADPAENLWWIRPGEDEEFLRSLHEVGWLRLMQAIG